MKKHHLILSFFFLALAACVNRFYNMPSGSMEATLPMNSKALVTETDHFEHNNIAVYFFHGDDYSKPQQPDGHFEKNWQQWVSRIIALSGDTLKIKGGDIFINGKEVPHAPKSLLLYEVTSTILIDDFPEREAQQLQMIPSDKGAICRIYLTRDEARNYSNRRPAILSVKRILQENAVSDSEYVRDCGVAPANIDNIGPIYIPRPGDTVYVKDCNRKLYSNIPGIQPGMNVIKEELFFMISDNWYGAIDSRYIGFISESKMYGVIRE